MSGMNAAAAEIIRRNALNVDDCRLLLEMAGLVEPDGHELLPDEALRGAHPTSTLPPDVVHVPVKQSTSPPGLRVLPPPTAPSPAPSKRSAPTTVRRRVAVVECGTVSRYAKHRRQGEETCQSCRDAAPAKWRERHPVKTPARPPADREADHGRAHTGPKPKPIPHGSMAGYRAHYRRQELPVCDQCNDAYRADQRAKAAKKKAHTVAELAAANSAAIAVELDTWFADAQRSPSRPVRSAATVAVGALVQLRMALDELARQERAAELRARSTGVTA